MLFLAILQFLLNFGLIKSEGSKLFISKLYDDVSSGIITFNGGLRSNKMTYLNQGV